MSRLILLTQPEYAPYLLPSLGKADAEADVAVVVERADLAATVIDRETRLVAFAAKVIVPREILSRLPGPAYNFHPGPPDIPGLFPSVHALYEGRSDFAVTLHEMAAEVDSGPIVAVERFAIPANADRLALDTLTFKVMVAAFERWAPRLIAVDQRLPVSGDHWSGRRRTRADFEALCDMGENPSAEEFARRLRAVGEGPEHALSFTRFGRRFRLASEATGPVVRGGLKVTS